MIDPGAIVVEEPPIDLIKSMGIHLTPKAISVKSRVNVLCNRSLLPEHSAIHLDCVVPFQSKNAASGT